MLYTVVYEDEIIVYWDKLFEVKEKVSFNVSVNGQNVAKTDKTHFTYKNATAQTEYVLHVSAFTQNGFLCTIGETTVRTPAKRHRIDITKAPYNAVGDGKTINTQALQRAFDDCKAGETVYFPAGVYVSGSLTMHSDTELYLDKGAVLKGSSRVEDYLPKLPTRFEGLTRTCYRALLKVGEMDSQGGYTSKNIVIRGGGAIYGGGQELFDNVIKAEIELQKDTLASDVTFDMVKKTNYGPVTRTRPYLIEISNAENIRVSNVEIAYGPSWNLHMIYSKNIVINACAFRSFGIWNGDGFDPDSCEDCDVFNCEFQTGDDAIAIKSGKNPEGNVINKPCRNLKIFDIHGRNGIAFGSEMSGGVENVWVWDCKMENATCCLGFKVMAERGGYIRNIFVYDVEGSAINIRNIMFDREGSTPAPVPATVENIHIENVVLSGVKGLYNEVGEEIGPLMFLGGDGQCKFKNIVFKNIGLKKLPNGEYQEIKIRYVDGVTLENIYAID